jgi:hypothetical protein
VKEMETNKKENRRERMATLCLFLGTFFLPLGYDIIIKMLLDFGILYWNIMFIFYLLSACFFGLFIYFSGIDSRGILIKKIKQIKKIVTRRD